MAKPRQGTGTHKFAIGTYTGEWCGGKMHGQGIMVYTSGSRCVQHAGPFFSHVINDPNQRKCAFLRAASSKSNAQGLQEEEQEID